ncbi:hypothetical protein ACHAWO_006688 [Cyclotella atomus]|uniref:Uncharacterized protein n=1 Tax=Cyclotella atomus TaxID=382360 RepID=A0ABD3Q9N1_9STRA
MDSTINIQTIYFSHSHLPSPIKSTMNLFTAIKAALLATFTSNLTTHAFQSPSSQIITTLRHHPHSITTTQSSPLHQQSDPSLSPEQRQANLFQSLLRDLQIQNVPLLSCDANQVHTLNAALWTTMAELSANPLAERVCLVLEDIPLSALLAFAEDFTVLKTQSRLMDHLPELKRFSVSLVGKGVGPAVLIETEESTSTTVGSSEGWYDKDKIIAALRYFISRVVVGMEACPYTKSVDVSASGLESRGVTPGPVGYRFSGTSDACQVMAVFWNCICELMAEPEENLSSIMLSLPGIGGSEGVDGGHERFAAVVELVGRYLCLFRGDGAFGLVHFYPSYDRERVHPLDMPAYGHLPPMSWLRPMLKMAGHEAESQQLSEEELSLANYQRRAPHTAINILRMSQVNAAAGAKSIVNLDLGNGRTEKASGIPLYSRNTLRMVQMGKDKLQAELDREIAAQQ